MQHRIMTCARKGVCLGKHGISGLIAQCCASPGCAVSQEYGGRQQDQEWHRGGSGSGRILGQSIHSILECEGNLQMRYSGKYCILTWQQNSKNLSAVSTVEDISAQITLYILKSHILCYCCYWQEE